MQRREFLRTGAAGLLCPSLAAASPERSVIVPERSVIVLMLVGGPSHVDTWDMKPDAPSLCRSPFRPIRTNVPGIEISEIFPRMARHADKYALVRSVHHDGAFHDSGHQLMQTGHVFEDDVLDEAMQHPSWAARLAHHTGARTAILPFPIGATGGNMPHGHSAGHLGRAFDPPIITEARFDLHAEPADLCARYGLNRFGQSCLKARCLVESGTRFVTVNMFETVFDEITWDVHGSAPFPPISAYRDVVGPLFDMAYSSLLEDLSARGLLDSTLVVAMGEFGRSPKINPAGGRDHWPQCSTILMAGGGVRGGQVIGSSDSLGAEPKDCPVSPQMIGASICQTLGLPHDTGAPPIPGLFAHGKTV